MSLIKLERIDDKLAALNAALVAAMPTRQVEIGFTPYDDRTDTELLDGVVNIVSAGEGNYHQGRGMAAKEGTLKVHLINHLKVAETASRADLQQAEINLAEEIKSFVRTGVAGMTLALDSIEQSRLLEYPYGWVVAFLGLRPPASNAI